MADLTQSTRTNLNRIDSIVENTFIIDSEYNLPLPSWIEFSIIDYCNRKCIFCPKSNPEVAPDQKHLYMSVSLAEKIATDLKEINYAGAIVLAGYGEPMASPVYLDIVKQFSPICRTEIVTNGDFLTTKKIEESYNRGLAFINVSIYTDQKRYDTVLKMFEDLEVPKEKYILRERWLKADEDYGLKLTNRAGTIDIGNQQPVKKDSQCFYPHYSMTVDWNGDVHLCPQDWHRKIKFGNLGISSVREVWFGDGYKLYRKNLYEGKRSMFPCSNCNTEGTCHGGQHAKAFNT